MLILCYPKCSTCKKALSWLEDNKLSYEYRDISKANPTGEELTKWVSSSGLPVKRFFNTSGIKYRELNLKEKIGILSDTELIELLSQDGMLVKRPLLIGDGFVLVGFKKAEWESTLLS